MIRSKSSKLAVIMAVAASMSLSACAEGNNQTGATLVGAGLGGLLGSQFGRGDGRLAMTALGTLAGAAIGSSVGKRMDEVDRMKMREAETRAYGAPIGEAIIWNNPDTGHRGTVTPVRDGRSQRGEYCREFQSEIIVGGERERGFGRACQQPDGSWKIVS
ncbi:MAG: RT0821/Lpp0805 family surface protein [Rhodospirillaceae bacterium]